VHTLNPIMVDFSSNGLYAHFYLTAAQARQLADLLRQAAAGPPGPGSGVDAGPLLVYVRRFEREEKEDARAADAQRA
jgi:hypothetical protein